MVNLKLNINYIPTNNILVIDIDNEKRFGDLREMISKTFQIDSESFSVVVGGYNLYYNFDNIKLKEIDGIYNECTLYVVLIAGEMLTININFLDKNDNIEIKIYNNQTLLELYNKVSKKINIDVNDFVLVGKKEYDDKYDPTPIKYIDGFIDPIILYVVKKSDGDGKPSNINFN